MVECKHFYYSLQKLRLLEGKRGAPQFLKKGKSHRGIRVFIAKQVEKLYNYLFIRWTGKHFEFMGLTVNGQVHLRPEETLYLLECSQLGKTIT